MGHYYSSAAIIIVSLSIAVYNCGVSSNGCATSEEDVELRQVRREQLKGNILAQLGFAEPPQPEKKEDEIPRTSADEIKQNKTIEEYWNLVEGTNSTPEPKCTTEGFYAQPITSFVGSISPTEGLALRHRRQAEDKPLPEPTEKSPGIEGAMAEEEVQDTVFDGEILNQYTIYMRNMNLPENLSVIAKAHLLLHQAHSDTINKPVLDGKQLVWIRAIINNTRYSVDKKSLSVYGHGPQSFNVLHAMELWVDGGRTGEMIIEVLVTCSSSPNCSSSSPHGGDDEMKLPAAVTFVHNDTHSSHVPRVITLSKSPLEAANTHSTRKKRQATSEPDQYCWENETTCCLHPLNISFADDLGLSFIREPANFITNYCDGFCPLLAGLGSSDRAQLFRFLVDSPATSVEPCCTGIEYKPLQVLMHIYNPTTHAFELKIDRLDQVIVTRCRCS